MMVIDEVGQRQEKLLTKKTMFNLSGSIFWCKRQGISGDTQFSLYYNIMPINTKHGKVSSYHILCIKLFVVPHSYYFSLSLSLLFQFIGIFSTLANYVTQHPLLVQYPPLETHSNSLVNEPTKMGYQHFFHLGNLSYQPLHMVGLQQRVWFIVEITLYYQ